MAVSALFVGCVPKEAPPPLVGGWEDGGYGLQAEARPPAGVLWRHEVDAALEAGLGTFLRRVAVEPDFDVKGNFHGFRVVALGPSDYWRGVDLMPGDVVTRVNDMPIERETEAFDAFESLREADILSVTLMRDERVHTLEYKIQPAPSESVAPNVEAPQDRGGADEPEESSSTGALGDTSVQVLQRAVRPDSG